MGSPSYDLANTTRVALKLNIKTDADVLARLDSVQNKQRYIKDLIRADIAAHATNENHSERRMNMKMKLYESYGVLAHEKKPVYSADIPASDAYNEITVNIPGGVEIYENEAGEKLAEIEGKTFLLAEVLGNYGDKPCLNWFDGKQTRRMLLEVV